jgi:signal transduction histidine kinase
MTLRTKLTLSVTALFALSLGILGVSLVRMESAHLERESGREAELIENTVKRMAQDALVQRDDLLLLSYVKFQRSQSPALSYVRVQWEDKGRKRKHHIGDRETGPTVEERASRVSDPTDPQRAASLAVGIDKAILHKKVEEQIARLQRDMIRLFVIAMIIGAVFSDWFARKITRPLAALSEVAGQIGRGKLGVRLEWQSKDEVGELVAGFNQMSARLEELDAMKKDFVSAVTHELRSPLGAIESFLNLMEAKMEGGTPKDPAQFRTYFDRIQANVSRLSGFINDLLDVAKIERGKMECALRPIRIQSVAADVVQFFEAKGKEQGVKIQSRLDTATGAVNGDPERLRQVFVNLVSNALKFTPRGGSIWIQGEQFREDGQKWLEVSVVDTGRGMDQSDMNRLFKKFEQGKNTTSRVSGHHGTGLGLVIVKSIVEAHGGKVSVKSQVGKGTQFLFNVKMV